MGNTVSAAEMAATQILHPNTPLQDYTKYHDPHYSGKDIPPECPMHKKMSASECPVNYGDVNPLNMVSLFNINFGSVSSLCSD